ncbi:MAG TPA: hypothetical protein VKT74_03320 [Gammaproteobacteria bacterium]|nr:hypothetical protein [Gammaproteobacteria bacterium]
MRNRRSDGLVIVFFGLLILTAAVHALPSPPATAPWSPAAVQDPPAPNR